MKSIAEWVNSKGGIVIKSINEENHSGGVIDRVIFDEPLYVAVGAHSWNNSMIQKIDSIKKIREMTL